MRSSSVNFINRFSMKRILAFLSLAVLWCAGATAQMPQPLYPDGKLYGDNGLDSSATVDRDGVRFGVAVPDYFLFRPAPDKANGQCVIVLPGGGYGCVCYQREGIDVARWLNENGVTAVVLRYRMPNGHHEIPLNDVSQMFRTVRRNATEWGIDRHQIGIMGFSAGGHLAASALTLFQFRYACPDFGILIYPVITMQDAFTHRGSRENLMGKEPSTELIQKYSTERHVVAATEWTPYTSPCFIALSSDDEVVPTRNSTMFYDSLCAKGVPAELHVYPTGRHGWIGDFVYWDEYHASLSRWLKQLREKAAADTTYLTLPRGQRRYVYNAAKLLKERELAGGASKRGVDSVKRVVVDLTICNDDELVYKVQIVPVKGDPQTIEGRLVRIDTWDLDDEIVPDPGSDGGHFGAWSYYPPDSPSLFPKDARVRQSEDPVKIMYLQNRNADRFSLQIGDFDYICRSGE